MSYYTNYRIEVQEVNPQTHLPAQMLSPSAASNNITPAELISYIEYISNGIDFEGHNEFSGLAKWYDWQTDLTSLSKKYPNLLFIVEGEGEDHDDMWICWITNGLLQYEPKQIIFNPYDPGKLSPPNNTKGGCPTC